MGTQTLIMVKKSSKRTLKFSVKYVMGSTRENKLLLLMNVAIIYVKYALLPICKAKS